MEYFLIFVAAVVIVAALVIFSKLKFLKKTGKEVDGHFRTQKTEDGKIDFVRCPLCSTPLSKGENMFSRVYRPMTTPDQRMTIHGCPHCYPKVENGAKRICPVCKKEVPIDGELVARLFNKTSNGKKHVLIVGCTGCFAKR